MHYDIAAKRIMEIGGLDVLRSVAGLEVVELTPLDEMPQEQATITRNDFAAKCRLTEGREAIVLLEFQTDWKDAKLLDMAIYAAQRMRRHHDLPVLQIMVLFKSHGGATERFSRDGLTFEFQLVRMWELDVELFLHPDHPALWPLAALAKDGLVVAEKVDRLLHRSDLPSKERSDLLTIFAIFLGMRDRNIATQFIHKRRELMIESPVYDLILDEGREEGREEGGAALRNVIGELAQAHFGAPLPRLTLDRLGKVKSLEVLQTLATKVASCDTMQDFERLLTQG